MALPDTITTGSLSPGHNPPHKSSGGNYYAVMDGKIYKSTNPGTSAWSEVDSAGAPSAEFYSVLSSVSDGTSIHIVYFDGFDVVIRYHRFNMSTDSWEQTNHEVADLSGMTAPDSNALWASIALRGVSGDEVVIAASGLTDADMGNDFQRVDLWHGSGSGTPSFTGPVAIDASVGGESEAIPTLATGASDRVHIGFLKNASATIFSGELHAKTFLTNNTLSTLQASGTNASDNTIASAISYDHSGTQYVSWAASPGSGTTNPLLFQGSENGSGHISSVSGGLITGTITNAAPAIPPSIVYSADGLYILYSGGGTSGSDDDLYAFKSTDNGSTWEMPAEELLDAVSVQLISAAILDTGKIAYVYDDGGTNKYNELDVPHSVTVSVIGASETDSAQSVADINPRAYTVTGATEPDTAQAVTADNPRSYVVVGISDSSSAEAVSAKLSRRVSVVDITETDTAQDIQTVNPHSYAVVGTTETGTAGVVSATKPLITIFDIDSDDDVFDGQIGAIISGQGFGLTQGEVYIGDVSQTITAWGPNSITITVVKGALSLGAQTLEVRVPV